ncbi:hypothetical protein [Kitasatospora sp. NPDC093679]|uniref:hypothetical protein n=1 Tax=Kitasatospora sp. NPDC093679 TaxID=3154983 RepID=UPI00341EA186
MSRTFYFHCDLSGCSVTAGVYLGRARKVELLVNGHAVGFERIHGHHAQVCTVAVTLPCEPPLKAVVEVALPGVMSGEPACTLVVGEERLQMPERSLVRSARPVEASGRG